MDAIFSVMPDLQLALLEMNRGLIPWLFTGSLLMGILAYFVGEKQGNGCLGCILGLFLGPVGLIITALMGRGRS